MEIKDNKLIVNIPKGMEIDTENTDVAKGVIMFKKKKYITYEDIVRLGFSVDIKKQDRSYTETYEYRKVLQRRLGARLEKQ